MKKYFLFVMLFISMSCTKEALEIENEEQQTSEIKEAKLTVTDGLLEFESKLDMYKFKKSLSDKNQLEIHELLKEKGLHSLDAKYVEIYERLNSDDISEEAFFTVIDENKKFVKLERDDLGEQELVQETDGFYDFFANENFLFKIADEIIDVRTLESGENDNYRSSCSNPYEIIYTVNDNGCKRDRRAKLRARSVFDLTQNFPVRSLVENQFRLRGQRKRLCIWINYSTGHQLFSTLSKPLSMVSKFNELTFDGPFTNGLNSCSSCQKIEKWTDFDELTFNAEGQPAIESAYAAGSTTGIGSNLVIIDCD